MAPRCRPPYEDRNARISILANGIAERPDTFVQTVCATCENHLPTGRAIRFRRRRNDAHARWSHQSSAMSCRPSRCRRAPPASHPRCHCQPSGGIAEKSNSSCRTPPADRATARRSASTKTSRPSHGDGCAADGQRDGSETVRNTPTHHRSTVRESRLPSAKSSLESILDSCVNRFVHAT